jgi:hypothetical protein
MQVPVVYFCTDKVLTGLVILVRARPGEHSIDAGANSRFQRFFIPYKKFKNIKKKLQFYLYITSIQGGAIMVKDIINQSEIASKNYFIKNQRVMLDKDLAELYQVEKKVLNQAVKRNIDRFPVDFMFQLTEKEFNTLRSQIVTSKSTKGGNHCYCSGGFLLHTCVIAPGGFLLHTCTVHVCRVPEATRDSEITSGSEAWLTGGEAKNCGNSISGRYIDFFLQCFFKMIGENNYQNYA